MYVLSLLKKDNVQPTEYYFNTFNKPDLILKDIRKFNGGIYGFPPIYFIDDYGHASVVRPEEIVEASVIDVKRKKEAMHELKMIDDYAQFKNHKAILADPRTVEIMQMQQPITPDAQPN